MSAASSLRRTLRLVEVAMFSLGLAALMAFLSQVVGGAATVGGGVLGGVLTWFCYHRAAKSVQVNWSFRLWRYAPSLLFVAFPLAYGVFLDDEETSVIGLLFEYIQPILSFVLPMICLAVADWHLRKLLRQSEPRQVPSNDVPGHDQATPQLP